MASTLKQETDTISFGLKSFTVRILTDTREQMPFSFAGYDVDPELAALPVGDYSLPGFEDRVAVERKSLNDLVGCLLGKDRELFKRERARKKRSRRHEVDWPGGGLCR